MSFEKQEANNDGRFPIVPILMEYGGEWAEEGIGWKKYKCPFHGDRQASSSVNTEIGVFNCSANKGCPTGNAVQIIAKEEGISLGSAIERAKAISGSDGGSLSGTPRSTRSNPGRARGGSDSRAGRRTRRSS
jgi:hypothetical protein